MCHDCDATVAGDNLAVDFETTEGSVSEPPKLPPQKVSNMGIRSWIPNREAPLNVDGGGRLHRSPCGYVGSRFVSHPY